MDSLTQASWSLPPTLLASILLIVTSMLIAGMLVVSFFNSPAGRSKSLAYKAIAILIASWLVLAWKASNHYSAQMSERALHEGQEQANRQVDAIVAEIDNSLRGLREVPRVLAANSVLRRHLQAPVPVTGTVEERRRRWLDRAERSGLSGILGSAAAGLDAELVWVVNAAGECIAVGGPGADAVLLGTSHAGREYFIQARRGVAWRQYASSIVGGPGLYSSHPVRGDGDGFLGAVVVKRAIADLHRWTRPHGAFVSDSYGVIVLAEEPALDQRRLPDSDLDSMPAELRRARYG